MRKKFVKVALLSLVACGASSAFVACSDDDWKSPMTNVETSVEGINKTITQLDEQVKALDAKIAQNKSAADAAAKAAADALAAAQAAQTSAEDAKKYADEAAQKYAEEAAARAVAQAAEELKAQIEAVKALIQANADAIANNKALVEGNAEAIKANAGKIEGNTQAIADLLESLNSYKGETNERLEALLKQLDEAGVSINDLKDSVAGISASLAVLEGKCESLGLDISDLETALRNEIGSLEANLAAQIANETLAREEGDKALQNQINDLSNKINALDLSTNLEKFATFVSETQTQLAALEAFKQKMEGDFAALSSKVDGIDAIVNQNVAAIQTLTSDLEEVRNQASTNAATIAAQAALISANTQAIGDLQDDVQGVKDSIESLKNTEIKNLQDFTKELADAITEANGKIDEINEKLNNLEPLLNTMILDQLRGLVFLPNAYVGGIESALSWKVGFDILTPIVDTPDVYTSANGQKVGSYKIWNLEKTDEGTDQLSTLVTYHMNPESAVVALTDLSIISNNAEVLTRSASEVSETISLDKTFNDNKGLKIENGNITVAINAEGAKGYADRTDLEYTEDRTMPVFALQAEVMRKEATDPETGKDISTPNYVTSDYAMFVLKTVNLNSIKWNQKKYTEREGADAWTNRTDVQPNAKIDLTLNSETTATVPYDGSDNIILSNLLDIQYLEAGQPYSWTGVEEWESHGLKMNFQLVPYIVNGSDESKWVASLDANTGELTPVDELDAIGHTPLVYVTVTCQGKTVLNGFVKVIIVPVNPYYKTNEIVYPNLTFNCTEVTENMPVKVDVFSLITQATATETAPGLTRAAFEANYKPDVKTGTQVMCQYVPNGRGYTKATVADDEIGEVTYSLNAQGNYVFTWDILDITDKQALYIQTPEHKGWTYICFTAKTDSKLYPNIYIPLAATINPKTVYSEIGAKVPNYWHRESAMLNAPAPKTGSTVTPISTDLDILWDNNNPGFKKLDGSIDYFTPEHKKYYFPATNNDLSFTAPTVNVNDDNNINAYQYSAQTYWFYVDKVENEGLCNESASNADMGDFALCVGKDGEYENNKLYVVSYIDNDKNLGIKTKVLIATLDQVAGQITYENTSDANLFLNMFSSMGGVDHPTADLSPLVAIVPWNDCDIAFKVENFDFMVTFLRPINVEFDPYTFTDADENGGHQNIFDMLKFSDWRGVEFEGENLWLFDYYQITSIKPLFDKMYDTLNSTGKYQPSAATTKSAFHVLYDHGDGTIDNTPISPIDYSDLTTSYGYITYDNLDATVTAFKVKIPFEVTYQLGTFTVYVTCIINPTMGS